MPHETVLSPELSLQDLALLLLWLVGQKRGTRGVFKDFADTLIRLSGAFQVLVCANLLADVLSLVMLVIFLRRKL